MDKDIDLLKDKLARACRLLEMLGLIDFSGHISARIPGSKVFFIHPRQRLWGQPIHNACQMVPANS